VFSDKPLGLPSGERIASAFRILMQVRVLVAALALLVIPQNERTDTSVYIVTGIGFWSWFAMAGWRHIVPWLLKTPLFVAADILVSYIVLEFAFAGAFGPFFLFTVMTSVLVGLLYQWHGALLICFLQILLYYVAIIGSEPSFRAFIGIPAFYLVGGFVGTAFRRVFDDHAKLDQARRDAEIATAAAEERARLAREMHDSLAKTLRGIAMSATALPTWMVKSPERAREEANQIALAAEIASREARDLISELRDEAIQLPLAEALPTLVGSWAMSSGVDVTVTTEPEVDLPLRDRHEAMAILKEALENVKRHAHAVSVDVSLSRRAGTVILTVRDDGKGFAMAEDRISELVAAGHYGVIGMRERAARMGGALTVTSEPGQGTVICLIISPSGEVRQLREAVETI
jgi:signal transduction histidine kinase